jgi:hypothetical protein
MNTKEYKEHLQLQPRGSGKTFMYGANGSGEVPLSREQRRMMKREQEKQQKKHTKQQKKIARKLGFME